MVARKMYACSFTSKRFIDALPSASTLLRGSLFSALDQTNVFQHRRGFQSTPQKYDSALIVVGLGLSGVAIAGRYTYIAMKEVNDSRRKIEAVNTERAKTSATPPSEKYKDSTEASEMKEKSKEKSSIPKVPIINWFKNPLERRFYDGGFEEKMSRREAALILGVRESASVQRIKESHRKVLMLNHPDKGGSTYMAGKINAAKEILLRNREL